MFDKFFCLSLLAILTVAEIPPYIKVCGRRNPKLDECITNSIDIIKKKLIDGIPEIDVPSINPMVIKNVKLVELPNFKASAANIKIYGFHNFKINYLHIDLEKKQVDLVIHFDTLKIESDYDVNAKLIIPVIGHGIIETETEDIKTNLTVNYKVVQRNGKNYAFFYSIRVKLGVADFKANFKATDGMDETLMTAINAALVNSKQEILENTIPNVEKKISTEVLDISNKIAKHFTYEELFPDTE